MDLYKRFADEFTEEDREKCIKTVHKVLEFAEISRREGLFALEDMVNENDNFFIKTDVYLIVDGTDPAIVKDILDNLVLSGIYSSYEKLNACIIINGFLSIQSGETPKIIQFKLASMLGERIFNNQLGINMHRKNQQERYDELLAGLEVDKPEALNESLQFEALFIKLNDESIQRVLRELRGDDVIIAFCGCSHKGIKKLLNNLSFRMAQFIANEIVIKKVDKQNILNAQERILEKVKELVLTDPNIPS